MPRVAWDVSARELYQRPTVATSDGDGTHWRGHGIYFGRWPDRSLDGHRELGVYVDWQQPLEPADDGCPAGWAASPFCTSVWRYVRRRTEGGGRVDNPFFDAATWQAQEAAMYLEDEQERWQHYRAEVDRDRWHAEHQKRSASRGDRR